MKAASAPAPGPARPFFWGVVAWAAAWGLMLWLDPGVELANLAMLLVLGAAIATLWLPAAVSILCSTLSVFAFNWMFVPPRGGLTVDVPQDALLLGSMLLVTLIVAALMAVQRSTSNRSQAHARQADQLRVFSDALRDAPDPLVHSAMLRDALADLTPGDVKVLMLRADVPQNNDGDRAVLLGEPAADQLEALWHCLRSGVALGSGTDCYSALAGWYLPMRGREVTLGAAFVGPHVPGSTDAALRRQAQALCDQFGLAMERALTARAAIEARDLAQIQNVRTAMLAAISHDYRTPLATIMGAASSLADQGDRLDPGQRERLARTIVDETAQLSRVTDNMLQLARLYAPGMRLMLDWESAEEVVGTVLQRVRRHDPHHRVRARLEPNLPLARCDALLLSQMLDNLVDNALKYSEPPAPVEIEVRRQEGTLVFAVRDRGHGVHPDCQERMFEAFQRGKAAPVDADPRPAAGRPAQRGAGVGLAVCRAIARAHGGDLHFRPRAGGGSAFEFWLPETSQPAAAEEAVPAMTR